MQCEAGAVVFSQCDRATEVETTPGADGGFDVVLQWQRFMDAGSGEQIDCRVEGACVVGALNVITFEELGATASVQVGPLPSSR